MSIERSTDDLAGLVHELRMLPDETEWVEFKVNHARPENIGEYISALSNSAALVRKSSAYVVWGIEDKSHVIVGTTFRPHLAKIGNEQLENWLLHMLVPRISLQFMECEIEGKWIVVAEIARAMHRPVQFGGTEYIRVGSYKKRLKDFPEKERALWRTFDQTPFEQQVAAERLSGSDVLSLLDYPSFFKLLEIPLPETRDGILSRLVEDRLIASREGGKWDILNLGALLFASDLREFRHLSRKTMRIIEYEGEGRVVTKREYPQNKGYAACFEDLIRLLSSILPQNEEMGKALRRSMPMYPDLAVRELVANAIIHQDFSMIGTGPMVEVFLGRLEITNPGDPLMSTDRFLDTAPLSRNEMLASLLRRMGICEERGSGIDKVVLQTEVFLLPAPLFEVAENHTRAVLFAPKPFGKMDRTDRVRACYLHACLQFVQRNQMTNNSLRLRFGLDEQNRAQVSRTIGEAIKGGLVRPYDPASGSRKHASYVPFWA